MCRFPLLFKAPAADAIIAGRRARCCRLEGAGYGPPAGTHGTLQCVGRGGREGRDGYHGASEQAGEGGRACEVKARDWEVRGW